MNFFYNESKFQKKKKKHFFMGGGGGGEGARVSDFFYKEPNLGIDGQTDEQAKPFCPFNFFEVGGITMH